ncbi:hypothetical protein Golob_026341 [Gossypium lobatum]|uniref:RNase H type-1 domain-containing protein n=1 Tax=Gossypium lobatum TaxID=34289 RepID=A0A7J8LUV6_9ROSI|nr:hypothetical protein [Gossypium lobatum]
MGSAFAGEALTCLEAVKMGLVLRLTKVIIEGDSLSVITKCNSSHTDKSEVSSYIHALATECVREGEGFYLIGSVPDSTATTLSDDWLREPD